MIKVPGAEGRAAQEAGGRRFLRRSAAKVCGGKTSQERTQESQMKSPEADLASWLSPDFLLFQDYSVRLMSMPLYIFFLYAVNADILKFYCCLSYFLLSQSIQEKKKLFYVVFNLLSFCVVKVGHILAFLG